LLMVGLGDGEGGAATADAAHPSRTTLTRKPYMLTKSITNSGS
jgi:hypothetical protein